jgi:hypothetical protein
VSSPTTSTEPESESTTVGPLRRAGKRDVWIVFWIVPAFYTLFGVIFFALAKVMPPPRPDVTTAQKVDFFQIHGSTIQIGFALLILVVGGAGISNGIVVFHMKRMTVGSVFAYGYLGSMAVGALPGCLLVAFCFLAATFRAGRDPEILALLYDLGLLSFVGSLGCFAAAYFVFAVAILYDKNANGLPTYPSGKSSQRFSPYRSSSRRQDPSRGTGRSRSTWVRSSSASG